MQQSACRNLKATQDVLTLRGRWLSRTPWQILSSRLSRAECPQSPGFITAQDVCVCPLPPWTPAQPATPRGPRKAGYFHLTGSSTNRATSDLFSHLSGFRDGISLSLCVPSGIRNNAVNPFIISIRGQTLPFPKKIIPEFKNWSPLLFRGSSLGGSLQGHVCRLWNCRAFCDVR